MRERQREESKPFFLISCCINDGLVNLASFPSPSVVKTLLWEILSVDGAQHL